jgi:hypothetical protein
MRARFLIRVLFLSSVAVAAACGGSSDDFLTGEPKQMQLQGTLDGMSVSLAEPNTGGISQDNSGGEFDFGGDAISSSTGTTIKLTWTRSLPDDEQGPATGTLTMGSGPFAGQALCAGDGTVVRISNDAFQFNVSEIRSGTACDQAHTGTLRGWFSLAQ